MMAAWFVKPEYNARARIQGDHCQVESGHWCAVAMVVVTAGACLLHVHRCPHGILAPQN